MCERGAPINGGRVRFGKAGTDYSNVAVQNIKDPLYTVSKTFTPTPLIREYFSRENLEWIQASLRRRIYELSEGKFLIGKQSETDIVVVMRSVFCMFGRNLCTCEVHEQVRQLNGEVLAMIVPDVYSKIQSYMGYKRDVDIIDTECKDTTTTFLDRGVSTSGPGRKVLTYPVF